MRTISIDPAVEILEIQLHPGNFNRDVSFILICTWQPVICLLKSSTQAAIDSPGHVQ